MGNAVRKSFRNLLNVVLLVTVQSFGKNVSSLIRLTFKFIC